ncbi:hypothetical protein AHiyo6_28880 [Arthrobacter sp. Hiyo6]|nr:hypothetical protein AHiyo6_28880 [Arthrobacter sp. Hiyo6]
MAESGHALRLPPVYYGTIDATPLWICLLHDAWKAGMPDARWRSCYQTSRTPSSG